MCRKLPLSASFILTLVLTTTVANANIGDGLVAYWPLDEGTGTTTVDLSGNGSDGTLNGGPSWLEGKLGGALSFDGRDDHVDCGNPPILDFGSNDGTISAWFNVTDVGNDDPMIYSKGGDSGGGIRYEIFMREGNNQDLRFLVDDDGSGDYGKHDPDTDDFENLDDGIWHHVVAMRRNGTEMRVYVDGVEDMGVTNHGEATLPANYDLSGTSQHNAHIGANYHHGNNEVQKFFRGLIDDVAVWSRVLTVEEINYLWNGGTGNPVAVAPPGHPSDPSPAHEATDVPRDVVLSWTPAENADKHDVYFGTDFDGVDSAGAGSPLLVSPAQDANTFEPGRLEFSQTYFWRIDEVNARPDSAMVKGSVWSFTVEPLGCPIPGENILVTASSYEEGKNPENTVNGSGLVGNLHSTVLEDVWLTAIGEPVPPWIQYDFDKAYKLHEMLVWNYDGPSFLTAVGLKDVVIEYSSNGTAWMQIESVNEFARASGLDDYAPNTTVAFDGIPVKSVKITANSNWSGGFIDQFGLSEVQFLQIPVNAREPSPDDGATGIAVDVTLGWRAGREAAEHKVSIDTDEQTVIDGTAPTVTVSEASHGPLSLNLGRTYFWRVDEVNEAEVPAMWQGDIWSFSTVEYRVVDDFESYTDVFEAGETIWQTWIDGLEDPQNGGSQVGYAEAPFAEQTTVHGGRQSMPLSYDNTTFTHSEARRTWETAQNWAGNGADTLTLYFSGVPTGFLELSPTHILMNGTGEDIFSAPDEGRFVYKQLSGDATIVARVDRIGATDPWAKAGVMIRQSLDAGSKWAMSVYAPGHGFRFQTRALPAGSGASDSSIATAEQIAVRAPVWIKRERSGDQFNAYYATNDAPTTWIASPWNPQTLTLGADVYIGLAVTSHATGAVTRAEFSNIATTGSVTGSWQSVSLGVDQPAGNSPDAFYVTVEDSSGRQAKLTHSDPYALTTGTWTAWDIALSDLRSAGVETDSVTKVIIGIGDRDKPASGAAGLLFIDDIRSGRSTEE